MTTDTFTDLSKQERMATNLNISIKGNVCSHQSVCSDELFWHNISANNANIIIFGILHLWKVPHIEPSIDEVCQIRLCQC